MHLFGCLERFWCYENCYTPVLDLAFSLTSHKHLKKRKLVSCFSFLMVSAFGRDLILLCFLVLLASPFLHLIDALKEKNIYFNPCLSFLKLSTIDRDTLLSKNKKKNPFCLWNQRMTYCSKWNLFAGDADQLQKATDILFEMKRQGLCPNTITYSILLIASAK